MSWADEKPIYEQKFDKKNVHIPPFRIVEDDTCYVVLLPHSKEGWKPTNHIFSEAWKILKKLPNPLIRQWKGTEEAEKEYKKALKNKNEI